MKTTLRSVFLALVFALTAPLALSQTMSYGPLYSNGRNAQGYPIFMLLCRHDHCIGPQGKDMGSVNDVARYMPEVQVQDIQRYGYWCWVICQDRDGNIVGKASPNYRNPYQKLDH